MHSGKSVLKSGAIVPLVAVISNPAAPTHGLAMGTVRSIVATSPNIVHFEVSGEATVNEALSLFARAAPAILVINGGTRTVEAVLQNLLFHNPFSITPPIAILPGQNSVTTASDLGMGGRPDKALKKLLVMAQQGRIPDQLVSRKLIELHMDGFDQPRVGSFLGCGDLVHLLREIDEPENGETLILRWQRRVRVMGYFLSLLLGASGKGLKEGTEISVKADGFEPAAGHVSNFGVTTLDKPFLSLRPYGTLGQGALKFSALKNGKKPTRRALLNLVLKGWHKPAYRNIFSGRTSGLTMTGPHEIVFDGDVIALKPEVRLVIKPSEPLTFVHL